jgi:hypothetical protein
MPPSQPYKHLFRCAIQLTALFFLNWSIHVLMPVVVDALMKGMQHWNAVSVVYCWYIQISFLIVTFSLRDHLWNKANNWIQHAQPFIKWMMLLAVVWVMFTGVQLLLSKVVGFSFLMAGEMLLLFVQLYCLVGIAAPMGRVGIMENFILAPSYRPNPASSGRNGDIS